MLFHFINFQFFCLYLKWICFLTFTVTDISLNFVGVMKIHTKLKEVSIIVPTESWHLVIYIYIFMKVKCLHHKLLSPWQNCFCGKRLLASGNKKTNKCCWVLWKSLCADSWLTFTQKCYGNFAMRTWHWMNLGWILNNEIVKVLQVLLSCTLSNFVVPYGFQTLERKWILHMCENMWDCKADLQKICLDFSRLP